MHFIQLSDLHLSNPDSSENAHKRASFVGTCLRNLARAYPQTESCVITGDLADDCEPEVYTWFRETIDQIALPVDLLVGNHDNRTALLSAFAGSGRFQEGFAIGERDTPSARLIFLDTQMLGSDAGELCDARLEWLENRLKDVADKPVFLFMHHPPCKIGDAILDPIRLLNASDLAGILNAHKPIEHIFFGHVHRELTLEWNGVPISSINGISNATDGGLSLNARIVTFIDGQFHSVTKTLTAPSRT